MKSKSQQKKKKERMLHQVEWIKSKLILMSKIVCDLIFHITSTRMGQKFWNILITNVRHNSEALDNFSKIMNVTNHTGL